jgi:hypothetical protein
MCVVYQHPNPGADALTHLAISGRTGIVLSAVAPIDRDVGFLVAGRDLPVILTGDIRFNENGRLLSGILKKDDTLLGRDGQWVRYNVGMPLKFDGGCVVR